MLRINLLPHREARRKQKKAAFFALLALAATVGTGVVLAVGGYNATRIAIQNERNAVIKQANSGLDKKIAEIATLKDEIEALKARQQAVEDLQSDRNQPVYLMDELVKQMPPGVYLKGIKQDGQKVSMNGYAQSQERVAELLRNLAGASAWLDAPQLGDVHAVTLNQSKTGKKIVEFNMTVNIRRPRDVEAAAVAETKAKGTRGGTAAAPARPASAAPARPASASAAPALGASAAAPARSASVSASASSQDRK
jgi:type IV pilus assembly protein PilN